MIIIILLIIAFMAAAEDDAKNKAKKEASAPEEPQPIAETEDYDIDKLMKKLETAINQKGW